MEQGPFSKELAALHLGDVEEAWRWGPLWQGTGYPEVRGESCVAHSWLFSEQCREPELEYSSSYSQTGEPASRCWWPKGPTSRSGRQSLRGEWRDRNGYLRALLSLL